MLSASSPLEGALSEEHDTPTQTHRMDKHLFSAHPSPHALQDTPSGSPPLPMRLKGPSAT